MLKIKLARFGKKHQPHFRIVVNEARDKRDGQYVALLGHYAPASQPKILDVNLEAYEAWLVKGAQPTETVAGLIKRYQTDTPFPAKKAKLSKKAKAKLAKPTEEPKVEAPAAEAAKPEAAETTAKTETPEPAAKPKTAPEVTPAKAE